MEHERIRILDWGGDIFMRQCTAIDKLPKSFRILIDWWGDMSPSQLANMVVIFVYFERFM